MPCRSRTMESSRALSYLEFRQRKAAGAHNFHETINGVGAMLKPTLLVLLAILPAFAQNDFPDGPAKEYVQKICLQCHPPAQLLSQHRTEADWKRTVARMAQKGISAPSDQFDAIA